MNNSIPCQTYLIDPTNFQVNQPYNVYLPSSSNTSDSINGSLRSFVETFTETFEEENTNQLFNQSNEYAPQTQQLLEQANVEFNSTLNSLDMVNLDDQKNVLVCPVYGRKFDLNISSVMLTPTSMSPNSYSAADDDIFMELEVGTSEECYYANNKTTLPPTPPLSPKEVVEKARYYVDKKKKSGNKRGRPAKESDDDIIKQIKILEKTTTDKKKLRIARNNLASRDYRRNKSKKRQSVDQKLEEALKEFDRLTKQHQELDKEIENLRLMVTCKNL